MPQYAALDVSNEETALRDRVASQPEIPCQHAAGRQCCSRRKSPVLNEGTQARGEALGRTPAVMRTRPDQIAQHLGHKLALRV